MDAWAGGRQVPVAVAVGVAAAGAVLVGVLLWIGVVMDLLGGHRAAPVPRPARVPGPGVGRPALVHADLPDRFVRCGSVRVACRGHSERS
jgi:hypothetical protein